MTKQERIKSIIAECEYGFISYDNLHGENDQGIDIIKDALERYDHKSVIKYESCPEDIVLCPSCGSTYTMRKGILMNYCSNCGQGLK